VSAVRSTSSLLSVGAVLALTLAVPGTALADPGNGQGQGQSQSRPGEARQAPPQSGSLPEQAKPQQAPPSQAAPQQAPPKQEKATPKAAAPASKESKRGTAPNNKAPAAKPKPSKPAPESARPAGQPADSAPVAPAGPDNGDPRGNNGTIKIDTVPGDSARANRPHPGCSFVLQFFGFDADQHADITFTGQAPTRSAGPLLTLTNQLISTTPADAAFEDGHSLTFTAADLGLLGTPTAAKGWHVKVAVDVLEAPGGAKQKVFWLDCPVADGAAGSDQPEESDTGAAGADSADSADSSTSDDVSTAPDASVTGSGQQDVAVLSDSASREETTDERAAAVSSSRSDSAATVRAAAAPKPAVRSTPQVLASVVPFAVPATLPFTGVAGLSATLALGLAAVGAGLVAQRAGRRRSVSSDAVPTGS
jgi:hypothetical protein